MSTNGHSLIGSIEDIYGYGPALREWAAHEAVVPLDIVPCAHGVYALDICPAFAECEGTRLLDHATWWWHPGDPPFLLAHTYLDALVIAAGEYRLRLPHGLVAFVDQPGDGWYGNGTLSVRFEMGDPWLSYPSPLEDALAPHAPAWDPRDPRCTGALASAPERASCL